VVHFNLRYTRKSATENYRGLLRMDDGVSTKAQRYFLGPKMKLCTRARQRPEER
jgi:hypothetical protein